jgi:uncharacterized protein YegL
MPFYLICDVSYTMRNEITALRNGITRICEEIQSRPLLDDVAYICVLIFADTTKVIVPLGRMSEATVPHFSHEKLAIYGQAFRGLAKEIADDYESLSWKGYRVYRPCAYFLTDGEPADLDWRRTFDETLSEEAMTQAGVPRGYPIFVPFGFREAKMETLQQLAFPHGRSKWYHARHDSFAEALTGLLDIIMRSVMSSSNSGAVGKPAHDLPDPSKPWISAGVA